MSTYSARLAMSKPAAGDTNWDAEINGALDTLDALSAMSNVFYVSPHYTSANLGNVSATDRRHFDTTQGALDVINAAGTNYNAMILVGPGAYNELLDIQESVHIAGLAPLQYQSQGGMTRIRGDGTLNPTITITPPDASTIYVKFSNLSFENIYAVNNAVEQDTYLLYAGPQTTPPSSQSCIDFHDCSLRMQTLGLHNKWEAGVRVVGHYRVRLYGARASGLSYGGGAGDGYVKHLFWLMGHLASGGVGSAQFERSTFHNSISYHADCTIINFSDTLPSVVSGWWHNCACTMARADSYTAGVGQALSGLMSDAAAENYNNKFSLSVAAE